MSYYAKPIANLIEEFAKLPGIGPKTAQRIAFYIINMPKDSVNRFAETLLEARGKIRYCSVCGNFTDENPCKICSSRERDATTICVVENPRDVVAMEKTREY